MTFNDILQNKANKENEGSKPIADCFKGLIARHSSQTLQEYIAQIANKEKFKHSQGSAALNYR